MEQTTCSGPEPVVSRVILCEDNNFLFKKRFFNPELGIRLSMACLWGQKPNLETVFSHYQTRENFFFCIAPSLVLMSYTNSLSKISLIKSLRASRSTAGGKGGYNASGLGSALDRWRRAFVRLER